jgi:chemotaxis signal transduction protein
MTATISDRAAKPAAVRFALVAVDGVEYAVDAAWVRRSLPAPDPLPAVNLHRGTTFPVIDLRQVFGLPARPAGGGASGARSAATE